MTTLKDLKERSKWEEVNDLMQDKKWVLSKKWLESYYNDPEHLVSYLSIYKFVSKMIGSGKSLLEMNSSHAVGAALLSKKTKIYLGLENNTKHLTNSIQNLDGKRNKFLSFQEFETSFCQGTQQPLDVMLLLNVDHPGDISEFFKLIHKALHKNGKACLALDTKKFDRTMQNNCFKQLQEHFEYVIPFSFINEIAHCGELEQADWLVYIGCTLKEKLYNE